MIVSAAGLQGWVSDLLVACGVPAADADLTARCIAGADIEGVDSHGVVRLPGYVGRIRAGLIDPGAEMAVTGSRPGVALLDARGALGPVAGTRAMEIASAAARECGIGLCAVRSSNHLGALSFYVEPAAAGGLIALAMSNSPPAMAPPGGREALLGTNPIAAGLPHAGRPIVIDMATSQVARGRLLNAIHSGEPIPPGWALDAQGNPTTDARAGWAGTMVPLGGAKGFMLALLLEALTAALPGAAFSPKVAGASVNASAPSNMGHAMIAIDPDAVAPGFGGRMAELAALVLQAPSTDPAEPIRLPGDRRRAERERRLLEGVDLPAAVVADLDRMADEAGIPRIRDRKAGAAPAS